MAGFSLVDVVVAASLIGIIASFSVPRFTRIANQARAAQVLALRDNVSHAAAFAHAQYLASGATLTTATMAGKSLELKDGYPDAGSNGIGKLVMEGDEFDASHRSGFVTFAKMGAPSPEHCSVSYRAAAIGAPAITAMESGGC